MANETHVARVHFQCLYVNVASCGVIRNGPSRSCDLAEMGVRPADVRV